MDDLRIQRMRARYRLSPELARAQVQAKPRLDRIMRSMVDDILVDCLASLGIGPHEQVCIDRITNKTSIDLDAGDEAIAVAWGDSIARALRDRLERGGSGVVRFRSLEHALEDLAISSARGELSRAWAWKKLGLWRGPLGGGRAAARRELVVVLRQKPRAIVPVLIAAAKAGVAEELNALWSREDARVLAEVLVASRGGSLARIAAEEELPENFAPAAWATRLSASVIFRTAGAELFLRATQKKEEVELAELVLLASLFEVEPEVLKRRAAEVAVLLAEPKVLEWVVKLAKSLPAPKSPLAPLVKADRPAPPKKPARAKPTRPEAPSRSSEEPEPARSGDEPARSEDDAAGFGEDQALDRSPPSSLQDEQPREDTESGELPELEPPIDLSERAFTNAGGLLFLHHLIRDLGIAEAITKDEAFAPRSIKGVMHILAMTLLPLDANDPAVLAFAGFGPNSGVTVLADPPPSRAESERLEHYASEIVARLRELFDASPDLPRDRLLLQVCRRRAEIVADPSWIEVHLELEEVSTEVRRVGLDLDLGWLPWIGVSVRFIYA